MVEIINKYIEKGLVLNRIPTLLVFLIQLNKNKIWSIENEIRLMTFVNYGQFDYKCDDFHSDFFGNKVYPSISKLGQETAYIEFPLFQKEPNCYPLLKIKKIILGYSISKSIAEKLERIVLSSTFKRNSIIPIEKSIYTNHFQ